MAWLDFVALTKQVGRLADAAERIASTLDRVYPVHATSAKVTTVLRHHDPARHNVRSQLIRDAIARGLTREQAREQVRKIMTSRDKQAANGG